MLTIALRDGSPNWRGSRTPTPPPARPIQSPTIPSSGRVEPTPELVREPDEAPTPVEVVPGLVEPAGHSKRDLALLEPDRRDIDAILEPPRPRPSLLDNPPPPPIMTEPSASSEPRRLLVRDRKGRAIVAREYGLFRDKKADERPAVVLPDGQIGWPDGLVSTTEPFRPSSMEEMRRSLLDDPEFAAFRVLQSAHYLVLYQSGEPFARASAELLEKLHDGLTGMLKKNGLPVAAMEFPLVAVIFRTEDDFRLNREVPREVQAYYEILSNRIYFYEKSRRDQDSPEVSALRKPQTVAHEGTHQILHNVGVQPRLSHWPLWLVEGLAEYCSPPKMTRKGVDWAGIGQVNPIHMATIRDLEDPLPDQFQGGNRLPIGPRDRKVSQVEYLVTRKDLTPTDYALAWALTHYLATSRVEEFASYLDRLSRMKPFQEHSPREQLEAFREVFGDDLAGMDAKVDKHLHQGKIKPTDSLPIYAVIFEQQLGATVPETGDGQPVAVDHPPVDRIRHPPPGGRTALAMLPVPQPQEGRGSRRAMDQARALTQDQATETHQLSP